MRLKPDFNIFNYLDLKPETYGLICQKESVALMLIALTTGRAHAEASELHAPVLSLNHTPILLIQPIQIFPVLRSYIYPSTYFSQFWESSNLDGSWASEDHT